MTERESEQFYHNLRQKLEGYGSAPPESVWAGIREQVPARRRRRWLPLLLLLFVSTALICLTIDTRFWRQDGAGTEATPIIGSPAGSGTALVAPDGGGSTTLAAANSPSVEFEAELAEEAAADDFPTAISASGKASQRFSFARLTAPLRTGKHLGGLVLSPNGRSNPPRAESAATSVAATSSEVTLRKKNRLALAAAALAASKPRDTHASKRTSLARHSEAAAASRKPGLGPPTATQRSRVRYRNTPALGATASESTDSFQSKEQALASRKKAANVRFSNERLALLVVRPPKREEVEPEVRAKRRPRVRPTRRELRLRGWSAQVLAGSGLTYRALGGTPTQLERLERPGVGYSVQATGAYALTRQLTVSAGLGYAQYGTTLNYRLTKDSADNARSVAFQDVYRFLTVPVQAQLTLQGNHRWRYGVQGGGTLALLTGARTTEGNACNCSQRQWQPGSTSPFQSTNLLLNVGAFANYQFAPGQWITIRPQGQLFLNSLTTEASGRAPRRPWSLGLQAGYSWDLDPRKH